MDRHGSAQGRLERVRRGRRMDRDAFVPLGAFLKREFERNIAQPHRAFECILALWEQDVPVATAARSKLVSGGGGVLVIGVASSSDQFLLERLLKAGMAGRILAASGGRFRRIQVKICADNVGHSDSQSRFAGGDQLDAAQRVTRKRGRAAQ